MTEEKLKECEQYLKEGNLLEDNDKLLIVEKGDYWEKILFFNMQSRGYFYFTKKCIIFIGDLGATKFKAPYKSIKDIKKCNVGLFIPTGIKLTVFDEKKNKNKTYKMSLLKRDKWIKYIEEQKN